MHYFKCYLEAWKRYGKFVGRSSKQEYWYFVLFDMLFRILFVALSVALLKNDLLLFWIYFLVTLPPFVTINVRRLHDANISGWWMMFFLILYGALARFDRTGIWIFLLIIPHLNPALLLMTLRKGSKGSNQYGAKRPSLRERAMMNGTKNTESIQLP